MSALSTAELDTIAAFAAPLTPTDREAFIDEVVGRLAAAAEIGPGLVHRTVREVQAKFVADRRVVGVGRPPPRTKYDRVGHFARPRRAPV